MCRPITIRAWSRAGRRTIGAHGGVISPADGTGCHGVRVERLGPNLSAPTFLELAGDFGCAAGGRVIGFPQMSSYDSPVEQGGFELTVPSDRSVSNQGRQPFCNDDATGTSIRFEVKDTLGIGDNKLRRQWEQQVPDRAA